MSNYLDTLKKEDEEGIKKLLDYMSSISNDPFYRVNLPDNLIASIEYENRKDNQNRAADFWLRFDRSRQRNRCWHNYLNRNHFF